MEKHEKKQEKGIPSTRKGCLSFHVVTASDVLLPRAGGIKKVDEKHIHVFGDVLLPCTEMVRSRELVSGFYETSF